MQSLPSSVLSLWRAGAGGGAVLTLIVLGVGDLVLRTAVDLPFPAVVVPVVVAVLVGAVAWFAVGARYRRWGFVLDHRWIQARWGVVVHHTRTVPRNRVQTVTTASGPVDRLLGLTTLVVHTAGSASPDLRIPHLEDATVAWLRDELGRGVVD